MRNFLVSILLLFTLSAGAQINSIQQIIDLSTLTQAVVKDRAIKAGWVIHEEGKMDTLQFMRIIPGDMKVASTGDNVMVFYRSPKSKLHYIVFQTMTKTTFEKYFKELKGKGFTKAGEERKGDESKALYIKGKYQASVSNGRESPGSPMLYMIGIKVMDAIPVTGMQPSPAKMAPVKKK